MPKKIAEPTTPLQERAFIVGVEFRGQDNLLSMDESLAELSLLVDTAGLEVIGQTIQRLDHPYVKTFIGPGKIEEIQILVEELSIDVIIFDDELSPRHQRELEDIFGDKVRIVDRTALILDIFAQHAHTKEGALQVELAQYEYRLPRLTRAWTHLARQAGGGGGRTGATGGVGLRGPGETQLEVDRRDIRRRITHLKSEIEKIRSHRQQHRSRRKKSGIPVVALVGYTNAGKSTLLNILTQANVFVADQLFATLDPVTRRVELGNGHVALMTDTVGFIQKLPTTLVAAFRATLEEITEADLLLHLVDITHPEARLHVKAVYDLLVEIEADHIPALIVLNKIDRLNDSDQAEKVSSDYPNAVAISALNGQGIPALLGKINQTLYENYHDITVMLPYSEGGLIALFHDQGLVSSTENIPGGVIIRGKIQGRLLTNYHSYIKIDP